MALAEIHPDMQLGIQDPFETNAPEPLHAEEALLFTTETDSVNVRGIAVDFTISHPANPSGRPPSMIYHGFAGSEVAYAGLREELATNGETAITIRTPRDATLDHRQERLQSLAYWAVIKELRDLHPSRRVNLLAHSMGSLLAAKTAAYKNRGNDKPVDNLVMVSPPGLTNHNIINLIPGAILLGKNLIRDLHTERPIEPNRQNAVEALAHILRNPVRTAGEMFCVAHCDTRLLFPSLGYLGVRTAILQLEDDELFKTSKVSQIAPNIVDHYEILQGLGHGGPITKPKQVATAVASYLDGLDHLKDVA